MTAIYNEIEPYPSAWLRNLIAAGHIAPGEVIERSVRELTPDDVRGPGQRHFFAGIGVWSYALRLAGVADDAPVWTASCPCQPFSGAGRRGGFADDRHLWPVLFELVRECRPRLLFGEQVSSPDGLAWFDAVSSDLEGAGYAVGAIDTCSAGVGAPHIRQRLYFCGVLADATGARREISDKRHNAGAAASTRAGWCFEPERDSSARELAYAARIRRGERRLPRSEHELDGAGLADSCRMGDADELTAGRQRGGVPRSEASSGYQPDDHGSRDASDRVGPVNGFWRDADWLACTDGKARPVEPGSSPLAHGAPARMGRGGTVETRARVGELKGYGNAINAEQAATFIRCVMDELADREAA